MTPTPSPALSRSAGSRDAARAMDALRRLVSALRGAGRTAVLNVGVTGAQLFVLQSLADSPGQSVSELAERTGTRQNTVSEVIARLVRRGLVRREVATDDARRAVVSLTPAGRAIVRKAPSTTQSVLLKAFLGLSATQRRTLTGSLEAWVAAARLENEPPTMFFEKPRRRDNG